MGKMLAKGGLVVAGAVAAVQANITWLVSGVTVILNFLKKSMPRMGPATAACKNVAVNSLPWNWTVLETKPQEGIGWPSALLSRGSNGPALDVQGTTLNVAPMEKGPLLRQVNYSLVEFRLTLLLSILHGFSAKQLADLLRCSEPRFLGLHITPPQPRSRG